MMSTPATSSSSSFDYGRSGLLQRKCACKKKPRGPEVEHENKKRDESDAAVQRKSFPGPGPDKSPAEAPPIVHEVLRSPGQPLDPTARARLEPRFGYDFSHVRVHADSHAAKSAEAVNAQAYTVGSHIVFGNGDGQTGDSSRQRILAHELAHVVQQGGRQASGPLRVAPADDRLEGAADRAADQVMSGGRASNSPAPPGSLQRLGANPGCTDAQAKAIHQAIFDANSMVIKARAALAADPLTLRTRNAIWHNFRLAGTAANASTIAGHLRAGQNSMINDPISCTSAGNDTACAGSRCGDTPVAGGRAFNICTDVSLAVRDPVVPAACVLHEGVHSSDATMTADVYSGWFGHTGSPGDANYPGTAPLTNADSYATLALELS